MTEYDLSYHVFDNQLYWWNKTLLIISGRWPYQDQKWRGIILFVLMSQLSSVTLGEMIYLIEVFGNIDAMMKCLSGSMVSYCAHVLVINSVVNFDLMKEIIETLKNNWMQLKNEDEIAIFVRHAKEGKSSIVLYTGALVTGVSTYVLQPFMSELVYVLRPTNKSHQLKHIIDAQFYVDQHRYYMPIYFFCASHTIIAIFSILALDAFFIMIVHHACGMHDVLGFTELLEELTNVSWLMQLTSISFTISFTFLHAMTKTDEPVEMLIFGLTGLCALIRLFYVSSACQKVLDYSVQIHQSITSWYEMPPEAKKLLIIMLLRTSRPSSITVGKFIPLNLDTFCSLLKVSMSCVTFILSVH